MKNIWIDVFIVFMLIIIIGGGIYAAKHNTSKEPVHKCCQTCTAILKEQVYQRTQLDNIKRDFYGECEQCHGDRWTFDIEGALRYR